MIRTSAQCITANQLAIVIPEAEKYTDFVGNFTDRATADAIFARRPDAHLWNYAIPRYLQGPLQRNSWAAYRTEHGITAHGLLMDNNGTLVVPSGEVDVPPGRYWYLADMTVPEYRAWRMEYDAPPAWCVGIMADIPVMFARPDMKGEYDWTEYDAACVEYFRELREAGTNVLPNFPTFGTLNLYGEVEDICRGAYIEAGLGQLGKSFATLKPGYFYIIGGQNDGLCIEMKRIVP